MIVHNLGDQPSIANQFLTELRDPATQKNRALFRYNLARLGEFMAYEISKKLSYRQDVIHTSLGSKTVQLPETSPVLLTILRAGLPFLEGFQRVFDQSETGFIGAYRVEGKSDLQIQADYVAMPGLEGKTVVLLDTMLATGKSVVAAIELLLTRGRPSHVHLASVIAAPEGIQHLKEEIKIPCSFWTFAIDEKLNADFYIVPGLGDAGDLSFGPK
ncbi:MAG: uracil phosphoribosyltransferase [Cytophagales bacterium]|nr:uracil phosphoribosyltransferase [Cytophagales bacterium]